MIAEAPVRPSERTPAEKAAVLALVLATSCNRCAHFKTSNPGWGRGCTIYDACKAGRPFGPPPRFVRRVFA